MIILTELEYLMMLYIFFLIEFILGIIVGRITMNLYMRKKYDLTLKRDCKKCIHYGCTGGYCNGYEFYQEDPNEDPIKVYFRNLGFTEKEIREKK